MLFDQLCQWDAHSTRIFPWLALLNDTYNYLPETACFSPHRLALTSSVLQTSCLQNAECTSSRSPCPCSSPGLVQTLAVVSRSTQNPRTFAWTDDQAHRPWTRRECHITLASSSNIDGPLCDTPGGHCTVSHRPRQARCLDFEQRCDVSLVQQQTVPKNLSCAPALQTPGCDEANLTRFQRVWHRF